jgi:anti-anti-sigma factor
MPPLALKKMLELEPEPGEETLTRNILDLTSCPYMDSSGVGMIVSHFVHCQKKGVKMIAVGLSPKVKDVFRITKVDSVIPLAATVEAADIG